MQITGMQLSSFPQSERTHRTSTRIGEPSISGTLEVPGGHLG